MSIMVPGAPAHYVGPVAGRDYDNPGTFGTGGFATPAECRDMTIRPHGRDDTPPVGHIVDKFSGSDRLIPLYPPPGAKLVSAAPGAGKTASVIANCLLNFPGASITIDGKGQSYYVAAGARKRLYGRDAILLTTTGTTHVFNPLLSIRADLSNPEGGEHEEADAETGARLLAAAIMGDNAIFEEWALEVVKAIMLYVRTARLWVGPPDGKPPAKPEIYEAEVRERSMAEVSRLLMLNKLGRDLLGHRMKQSTRRLVRDGGSMVLDAGLGDGKLGMTIGMFGRKNLAIFGSREVRRMTYKASSSKSGAEPAANDVDMSMFRGDKKDIYMCFPLEDTARYSPVLRLMIGTMIAELRRSDGPKDAPGVNMYIDEFPQLKSMSVIADWILFLRSSRIYPWFFIQDPASLKRNYPDSWSTFEAVTTKIVFGVNDIMSAKHWSEYLGMRTVENMTYGQFGSTTQADATNWTNTGGGYTGWDTRGDESSGTNYASTFGGNRTLSVSGGDNTAIGWVGRPVMTPDEVMRMQPHEMLMFIPGKRPIRAYLIPYFRFPHLAQLSQDNPPPIRLPFEDTIEK